MESIVGSFFRVRLFLLCVSTFQIIGCGNVIEEQNGSSLPSKENAAASKLYIGGDSSDTAYAGLIVSDDLGRSVVGVSNLPGENNDLVMVIVNLPEGTAKIAVSVSGKYAPPGRPYLINFADGSQVRFSSYTDTTVDITLIQADGSRTTSTGVDISDYIDEVTGTAITSPYITRLRNDAVSKLGAWDFFKLSLGTINFALCPVKIAFAVGTSGIAMPLAIASCGLSAVPIWSVAASHKESFDKAYSPVDSSRSCMFDSLIYENGKACAISISEQVKANGIYIGLDGTVVKAGDSLYAGSVGGNWIATGDCDGLAGGTFVMNIASTGAITGSYGGSDSGAITGNVDNSGNFSSGSGGATGGGWSGSFTRNGGDLSGSGGWSAFDCSGSWSGSGLAILQ